jgi:hypothetical protein
MTFHHKKTQKQRSADFKENTIEKYLKSILEKYLKPSKWSPLGKRKCGLAKQVTS